MYRFQEFYIPDHMMEAIDRYISNGELPGDFLRAVISNDLSNAVGRADDVNLRNLPAYVAYFYNEAPGSSWGSLEEMIEWSKHNGRYGLAKMKSTIPCTEKDSESRSAA